MVVYPALITKEGLNRFGSTADAKIWGHADQQQQQPNYGQQY